MENFASYISVSFEVRFGELYIRGTQITITDILQWMALGMSREEILSYYRALQDTHIRAANFAADRELFIQIVASYSNPAFAWCQFK